MIMLNKGITNIMGFTVHVSHYIKTLIYEGSQQTAFNQYSQDLSYPVLSSVVLAAAYLTFMARSSLKTGSPDGDVSCTCLGPGPSARNTKFLVPSEAPPT